MTLVRRRRPDVGCAIHKWGRVASTTGPVAPNRVDGSAQAEFIRQRLCICSEFGESQQREEQVELNAEEVELQEEVRELRETVAEMTAAIFETYPEIAAKLDAEEEVA